MRSEICLKAVGITASWGSSLSIDAGGFELPELLHIVCSSPRWYESRGETKQESREDWRSGPH
jgi:hypothetical protein